MLIDRLTSAVAGFSIRRPVLALSLSIAVCLLLAIPALGIRLDTDIYRLLPDDSPAVKSFREMVAQFGATDQLFVAVEAPVGADGLVAAEDLARAAAATDRIADGLTALRDDGQAVFQHIEGRRDDGFAQAAEDLLIARTPLFLDERGLGTVIQRLQPKVVDRYLRLGDGPTALPRLAARDPLRLWTSHYLPYWQDRLEVQGGVRRQGGHLVALDGRFHLLALRPTKPAQERAFTLTLVDQCQRLREAVAADPAARGLAVHFLGGHFIAAADFRAAHSNALSNIWQGALGILLLFGVAYRSLRLITFIAITVVPATIAALGLTRLVLGTPELSLVAASFATVLIGLGVDFIIHIYNAYGHELQSARAAGTEGDPRARAAARSLTIMAPSIFAGVLTTVAAFVVLGFSEFRGLRELGIVAGIGLSLMLVQLLVALPAFLARFGPRRIHHATHLAWLGRSVLHRRWLYGGLTVVALLGAVVVLTRAGALTRFDSDARNLRPAHDPLLDQQRALLKDLGLGSDRLQIMLAGADTERVIEAAATLAGHAAAQPGTTACTLVEPLPRSLPDAIAVAMPEGTPPIAGGRVFDTPIGRLRAERVGAARLEGLSWVGAQRPAPGSPPLAVGTPITMRPLFAGPPPAVISLVSPVRQRAALARLASEVDWDGLSRLESGLPANLRERHRGFFADLAELRERTAASKPLTLDDFAGTPLAPLVRAFYRRADGRSQLLARFQADDLGAGGLRVADYAAALSIDAVAANSGVSVTPVGVMVLGEALQDALLADFARLGLWTALAVFALLMLLMRGFDAVVAMLALAAGALLMLAGMQLADLSWNLVNIGVLPLIIGIGIDASIYFINALRRHRRDRHGVGAALAEVAHPMLMTSGAAIIGFASLLGSDYRGLRSMGLVAILGMITCLLVAVVALPVAALFTSHRRHRPEDPHPRL